MNRTPITVVALLEDKVRVTVVLGHHFGPKAKQIAVRKAQQLDSTLPADGKYEVWMEHFDPKDMEGFADQLLDKAKKLRFVIFKY